MQNISKLFCLIFLLLILPSIAHAANWNVCRMQVKVTALLKQSGELQAHVLQVKAKPSEAECPTVGQTIRFAPESSDYQSMLPRKQWPRLNQTLWMRYQYLDGVCKNDGDSRPCRISHYPLPQGS